MSRFVQGDGHPILYVYENSELFSTLEMPYVKDLENSSYIKQTFQPYPAEDVRHHDLLSGAVEEDPPISHNVKIEIKYSSILASDLSSIFNRIIEAKYSSNRILKLKPRHNYGAIYSVIYKGAYPLETKNMWKHSVLLTFVTSKPINIPPFFSPTAKVSH